MNAEIHNVLIATVSEFKWLGPERPQVDQVVAAMNRHARDYGTTLPARFKQIVKDEISKLYEDISRFRNR